MPDPNSQQQDVDPEITQRFADAFKPQVDALKERLKAYGYPEISMEQAWEKMLAVLQRETLEKAVKGD